MKIPALRHRHKDDTNVSNESARQLRENQLLPFLCSLQSVIEIYFTADVSIILDLYVFD